jgi:hypothetical protein
MKRWIIFVLILLMGMSMGVGVLYSQGSVDPIEGGGRGGVHLIRHLEGVEEVLRQG